MPLLHCFLFSSVVHLSAKEKFHKFQHFPRSQMQQQKLNKYFPYVYSFPCLLGTFSLHQSLGLRGPARFLLTPDSATVSPDPRSWRLPAVPKEEHNRHVGTDSHFGPYLAKLISSNSKYPCSFFLTLVIHGRRRDRHMWDL